jgi:hypothetical protein
MSVLLREDLASVKIKLCEILKHIVGLNFRQIWREQQNAFEEIFEVLVYLVEDNVDIQKN